MENSKKRTRDKVSQSSSRATENEAPSSQLSQNSDWGFSQFITTGTPGASQTPTPSHNVKAPGPSSSKIPKTEMPTTSNSHNAEMISASQKNKAKKTRLSQSSLAPATRPSQVSTFGTPYARGFFNMEDMEVPSSSQFFGQSTSQAFGPERPPMSQLFPVGQGTSSTPQLEPNLFGQTEQIVQERFSQRPIEKISSTPLLSAQMWRLGRVTEGKTSTWSQLIKSKVREPSQYTDSQAWRPSQQAMDHRPTSHANMSIKNDQNDQWNSQAESTTQNLSQLSMDGSQSASQASETDVWSSSRDFEAGVWPSVSQLTGDFDPDTPPEPPTSDSDMDPESISSSCTDSDQDDSDGDDSGGSDTTVRPHLSSSQYDYWETNESQWDFSYSQDSQRSQELGDHDESEDGYPSRLETFMDGRHSTDEGNEPRSGEMYYGAGPWFPHPSIPEWLPELEGDDDEGSFYEPLKRIRHQ